MATIQATHFFAPPTLQEAPRSKIELKVKQPNSQNHYQKKSWRSELESYANI
jgi:hypothetical protein